MNEKLHSVIVFIENFLIDFLNIFGINQEDYYLCKSQLILYIQKLYHLLLDICITFICISLIVSIVGYIIDKNKNYDAKKSHNKIRLVYPSNSKSGGEIVCKYWVWQRKKKKLIESLITHLTIHGNKNSRHARINTSSKPIPFPFLREVYGLSKSS